MCIYAQLCLTFWDPHGQKLVGPLCPWNFPGKNTGACCHVLLQEIPQPRDQTHVSCIFCISRQVLYQLSYQLSPNRSITSMCVSQYHVQLFVTPWINPSRLLLPGILQARILEWIIIPFSRGSSQPRDRIQVSCTAARFFSIWVTREPHDLTLASKHFEVDFLIRRCPCFINFCIFWTYLAKRGKRENKEM